MDKKMLALDLDGTLLRSDKTISDACIGELRRLSAAGVTIVAATGRGYNALPDEVVSLEEIGYAVTLNGAAVYAMHPKTLIKERFMSGTAVDAIMMATYGEPGICYEIFMDGQGYANKEYVNDPLDFGVLEHSKAYIMRTRKPVADIADFVKEFKGRFNVLNIIIADRPRKKAIMSRLCSEVPDIYVTESSSHLIEISPYGSGKENALAKLAGSLGIAPDEIVAMGDADNDEGMLKEVGCGVAMGNASDKCKAAADFITSSNDEDGVAAAIKKLWPL